MHGPRQGVAYSGGVVGVLELDCVSLPLVTTYSGWVLLDSATVSCRTYMGVS